MARDSPSPYWLLRMVAERDEALSFHARHVFNRILSMRAIKRAEIDDVFPLPWPVVSKWINLEKKQCLRYLIELEKSGYIRREGLRGCPPTRQIRIVEAMGAKKAKGVKKEPFKGVKKEELKTPKKDSFKGGKKEGHLIYSLSDKEELKGEQAPQSKMGASLGDGKTSAVSAVAPTGAGFGLLTPASGDPLEIIRDWKKTEGHA